MVFKVLSAANTNLGCDSDVESRESKGAMTALALMEGMKAGPPAKDDDVSVSCHIHRMPCEDATYRRPGYLQR